MKALLYDGYYYVICTLIACKSSLEVFVLDNSVKTEKSFTNCGTLCHDKYKAFSKNKGGFLNDSIQT